MSKTAISLDEQIEEIKSQRETAERLMLCESPSSQYHGVYRDQLAGWDAILATLEKVKAEGWVSVKTSLPPRDLPDKIWPEQSETVWCTDGVVGFAARYNHDRNYWEDGWGENLDVTHWRPLPTPPQDTKN